MLIVQGSLSKTCSFVLSTMSEKNSHTKTHFLSNQARTVALPPKKTWTTQGVPAETKAQNKTDIGLLIPFWCHFFTAARILRRTSAMMSRFFFACLWEPSCRGIAKKNNKRWFWKWTHSSLCEPQGTLFTADFQQLNHSSFIWGMAGSFIWRHFPSAKTSKSIVYLSFVRDWTR